jgi:hypothetical protein
MAQAFRFFVDCQDLELFTKACNGKVVNVTVEFDIASAPSGLL